MENKSSLTKLSCLSVAAVLLSAHESLAPHGFPSCGVESALSEEVQSSEDPKAAQESPAAGRILAPLSPPHGLELSTTTLPVFSDTDGEKNGSSPKSMSLSHGLAGLVLALALAALVSAKSLGPLVLLLASLVFGIAIDTPKAAVED